MTTAASLIHHRHRETALRLSSSAASTTYAPANSRIVVVLILPLDVSFSGLDLLYERHRPAVYVTDVASRVQSETRGRRFVSTVGKVANPIIYDADLGVQLLNPHGHRQITASHVVVVVDVNDIL